MPKVSSYTRKQIQALYQKGFQPIAIFKRLKEDGSTVSYPSVARIIDKIKCTGSVEGLPKSGRPRKLNELAREFIEAQMNYTYVCVISCFNLNSNCTRFQFRFRRYDVCKT